MLLHRSPSAEEQTACLAALEKWRATKRPEEGAGSLDPARVHLVWALLNHNDFVTLR